MDLRFQPGLQPRQLPTEPDHLTQLTHRRRRHPRLREPTHPQQIRQQRRIPIVVLDAAMLIALDPQRMSQVQPMPSRPDHVRRPIPAERRLHRDLQPVADVGQRQRQVLRRVVDLRRRQPLTITVQSNDHRTTPVQVDTYIRSHQSLLAQRWTRRLELHPEPRVPTERGGSTHHRPAPHDTTSGGPGIAEHVRSTNTLRVAFCAASRCRDGPPPLVLRGAVGPSEPIWRRAVLRKHDILRATWSAFVDNGRGVSA
jgi:hypothetical protein